jgi:hypothetical protein
MKRLILALAATGALLGAAGASAEEVIIQVRPPAIRHEVRPHPPHRGVYWDPGHWQWGGREYVWISGHYVEPPRHGAVWIAGSWRARGHGWVWVDGHWR